MNTILLYRPRKLRGAPDFIAENIIENLIKHRGKVRSRSSRA